MRHEERYDGEDDAPFAGGSTEQKDQWLGEQLGRTRVGSLAFRQALHVAFEALHDDTPVVIDEIEEASALARIAGMLVPCASPSIFCGNLYAERRHELGRPLTEDEVVRIDAFARGWWARTYEAVA